MTQARSDCDKRSRQSIRWLHSLGLAYHSRDFPSYSIGKGLVGEIRGGHPEIFSRLLIRERSGSVVECLTRGRGGAGSSLTGVTAL